MSAFEIITKEEYEDSVAVINPDEYHGEETGAGAVTATEYPLTWCEFCKGYYIEEFHFGGRDTDRYHDGNSEA